MMSIQNSEVGPLASLLADDALILNAIIPEASQQTGVHPSLLQMVETATFPDLLSMAGFMLFTGNSSDPGSLLYAAEHNSVQFIDMLYQNALGRAPEADGLRFYQNVLQAHPQHGLEMVIVGIATSPEATQHAAGWLHV